jgi:hypothetical protein
MSHGGTLVYYCTSDSKAQVPGGEPMPLTYTVRYCTTTWNLGPIQITKKQRSHVEEQRWLHTSTQKIYTKYMQEYSTMYDLFPLVPTKCQKLRFARRNQRWLHTSTQRIYTKYLPYKQGSNVQSKVVCILASTQAINTQYLHTNILVLWPVSMGPNQMSNKQDLHVEINILTA